MLVTEDLEESAQEEVKKLIAVIDAQLEAFVREVTGN